MEKKTLFDLDFYKIRDEISGFCISEEGKFAFSKIEPLTDLEKIENTKNLSREWIKLLSANLSNPLSFWPPVFEIFKTLKIKGSSLSLEQIFSILIFIQSVEKTKNLILNNNLDLDLKNLSELSKDLSDFSCAKNEILKIINEKGELKDLPEIRAIKNKIASLNAKIREVMHKFTSDQKYFDILESTVPVLKSNRQVLAVKSSRRSSIPGIIHEVSQTGLTVFIEPEECVKCSNDLIEAEAELEIKIRKILLELTEKLSDFTTDFSESLKIMKIFDTTLAAAKWGKQNDCTFAQTILLENEPLTLLQARHPILKENAVPIDVKFLPQKRILILTGPNTGGKTVTLKTIALFSVLNQCAFPVPSKEGTKLPIFTKIFADIGDEQSMQESLSTFSGHMKNISKAIKYADSSSLVLLDELGSGTDPQEGSAIAMATLDNLIEKNAFVLITTHLGVIKNYGYTHFQCINASVEFNSESLSPTYKILMGVPGESHALDIAKKSGIPNKIIENAKNYITTEKTDISSLIKGLSQKHQAILKLEEELKQKENDLEISILKNEQKSFELRQKEFEIKEQKQNESYDFLSETRKMLENLVRTLKEGEITREKTLSVKSFINDLQNKIEQNEKSLENEKSELNSEYLRVSKISEKIPVSHKKTKKRTKNSDALKSATPIEIKEKKEAKVPLEFKIGSSVISNSSRQKGTILKIEKNGDCLVQFGSLKITLPKKNLTLVEENESSKNGVNYSVEYASNSRKNEKPVFELRLLGLREEEALKSVEHQIDLCLLQNFKNFSIIHGKGNGILQSAVQNYLKCNPHVKSFEFATPEDGGFGKTYVHML